MAGAVLLALLLAAAPLLARASEALWGLVPCALCLWQRWPYWAGAALALGAAVSGAGRGRGWLLGLAGGAAVLSAGLASAHLGVEWGWWPSPLPGCQAGGAPLTLEEMLARAPAKPCDEPTLLIPGLPLSMAAMNLIYGTVMAVLAVRLARKEFR